MCRFLVYCNNSLLEAEGRKLKAKSLSPFLKKKPQAIAGGQDSVLSRSNCGFMTLPQTIAELVIQTIV